MQFHLFIIIFDEFVTSFKLQKLPMVKDIHYHKSSLKTLEIARMELNKTTYLDGLFRNNWQTQKISWYTVL